MKLIIGIIFFWLPVFGANADEKKVLSIGALLEATKFPEGVDFSDESPDVVLSAIGKLINDEHPGSTRVFLVLRPRLGGIVNRQKSYRKVTMTFIAGVNARTVFDSLMRKALWHWEIVDGRLFVYDWSRPQIVGPKKPK